jgi:hypothetical protein
MSENSFAAVSDRRLLTILSWVFAITALADFLFWYETPGLSLALFTVVLMITIVANGRVVRCNLRVLLVVALLLSAAAQSAIEISFSNVLITLVLLCALIGETSYAPLTTLWARVSEAIWSLVKTPGRWAWLLRACTRKDATSSGKLGQLLAVSARAARMVLPGFVIASVFALLLANGNAIFGHFASDLVNQFIRWLAHFDLSLGRIFFWLACALCALPFVQTSPPPDRPRFWLWTIPLFRVPRESKVALWQSRLILALLNALFFAVNTIDAIYLWVHATLPGGVSYSEFVHNGVFQLVVAVLLSALLLAGLFQQASVVTGDRPLRSMALFWIAQNLVLLVGVLLRLKLYVDACGLSELRVYVAIFLLLVAAGFGTLAIRVLQARSLNWLILSNLFATAAVFYVVQFCDVAGVVAHYNVTRWIRLRDHLDVAYLKNLGPSAWPWLREVAAFEGPGVPAEAREKLGEVRREQSNCVASLRWRSWQGRQAHYAREILRQSPPSG